MFFVERNFVCKNKIVWSISYRLFYFILFYFILFSIFIIFIIFFILFFLVCFVLFYFIVIQVGSNVKGKIILTRTELSLRIVTVTNPTKFAGLFCLSLIHSGIFLSFSFVTLYILKVKTVTNSSKFHFFQVILI